MNTDVAFDANKMTVQAKLATLVLNYASHASHKLVQIFDH